MTTDRAVMQQALDALKFCLPELPLEEFNKADLSIAALRQALAQPVPDVAAQGQDALDAKRYRHSRLGYSLVVKCKSATIITGPNFERDYGPALDSALDAAMGTQPALAVEAPAVEPVTTLRVVESALSCKTCSNRNYNSGGVYYCTKTGLDLPGSCTIPPSCPLPLWIAPPAATKGSQP